MRHATLVLALLAIAPLTAEAKPKAKAGAKAKGGGKLKKVSGKAAAKVHTDKAAKAHKAGKFDEALTELRAAYEADPEPKLLFAIAQVQAKLDQCPDAIGNYEKFLAATKDKKKQAVVKQAIEACNVKVAAAAPLPPPKEPPPPPVVATTEPTPAPVVTEPAPNPIDSQPMPPPVEDSPLAPMPVYAHDGGGRGKPWYKDVIGDALVLTGVAAGAVSVVMYTGARSTLDDAEAAGTIDEYNDLVDKAHDKRTYSLVLAGTSAVLISAGLVHYKLRDKGEVRGIAVAPVRGGGGLITWTGGF